MVNLDKDFDRSSQKAVYGDQEIFHNNKNRIINEVSEMFSRKESLITVMKHAAEQRNKIAQLQLEDIKQRYDITPQDVRKYQRTKYRRGVRLKNRKPQNKADQFHQLLKTYCIMRKTQHMFGKVRKSELDDWGIPNSNSNIKANSDMVTPIELETEPSDKIKNLLDLKTDTEHFIKNNDFRANFINRKNAFKNGSFLYEYGTTVYKNIQLTTLVLDRKKTLLQHTQIKNFEEITKILLKIYDELLKDELEKLEVLTLVAKMQWFLSHCMLYLRGSSSITEMITGGIMKHFNTEVDDFNYDLEALTQPSLDAFTDFFVDRLNK